MTAHEYLLCSHCHWSILFELLYYREERDSSLLVKGDSSRSKGIWRGALHKKHYTDREVCGIVQLGELETTGKLKDTLSEQRNITDTLSAGQLRRGRESGQEALLGTEKMPPTRHSLCIHIIWI